MSRHDPGLEAAAKAAIEAARRLERLREDAPERSEDRPTLGALANLLRSISRGG